MQLICLYILLHYILHVICANNCEEWAPEDFYSNSDQVILLRERRAVNFYQTGQKVQNEMSRTLNQLLGSHYNKRIRPGYGGEPVLVELNLSIRSIVSLITHVT